MIELLKLRVRRLCRKPSNMVDICAMDETGMLKSNWLAHFMKGTIADPGYMRLMTLDDALTRLEIKNRFLPYPPDWCTMQKGGGGASETGWPRLDNNIIEVFKGNEVKQ